MNLSFSDQEILKERQLYLIHVQISYANRFWVFVQKRLARLFHYYGQRRLDRVF